MKNNSDNSEVILIGLIREVVRAKAPPRRERGRGKGSHSDRKMVRIYHLMKEYDSGTLALESYGPMDSFGWRARLEEEPEVWLVDNAPLRDEFLRQKRAGELSLTQLAVRFGAVGRATSRYPSGQADTSRMARMLGLVGGWKGEEATEPRTRMIYTNAIKMAEALGISPSDVGL